MQGTFDRLRNDLATAGAGGTIGDESVGIVPDRALVLTVVGSLPEFVKAANAAGLEFLGEDQADLDEGERPKVPKGSRPAADTALLYLSMASERALVKLLGFWDVWSRTGEVPEGATVWKGIFPLIVSLRNWDASDRIEEPTVDFILRRLAEAPDKSVVLEVDLWFRQAGGLRRQRRAAFVGQLKGAGGDLLDEVVIEDIQYHGMLVSLPPAEALRIIELQGAVALSQDVMSVRPQSLASFDRDEGEDVEGRPVRELGDVDDRPPLIGVLDGFPVANHAYLRGRIDVHTVDVEGEDVPLARRFHGTQMASLVLHGDLHDEAQASLPRRIASIPVLTASADGRETTPPDKLPIGMIRRAVEAMLLRGENDEAPLAPSIIVFNHSIVDENRPYRRVPSAWARLLDHLMFAHNILFVTSAGNIHREFELEGYPDARAFRDADSPTRAVAILRALHLSRATRRLMSPAESLNGLTIGALHEDLASAVFGHDPFELGGSAAVYSALGPGVGGSVKPDFVVPGGRQLVASRHDGTALQVRGLANPGLGHLTAVPDVSGLTDNARRRCSGTSNAAALTTRMIGWLAEAMEEIADPESTEEAWDERPTRAVVLKALAAHGARWGAAGSALEALADPLGAHHDRRRRNASGFIGYGPCDVSRVISGSTRRVTMLAEGMMSHHERHEYDIPLPAGIHGIREVRDIDLTLAWMSPSRPRALNHRAVGLVLTGGTRSETDFWGGATTGGILQPPSKMVSRGTLKRIHLRGDRVMSLAADDSIRVGVQATAVPGFRDVPVPYAVAITIEVGSLVRDDIHEQVSEALRLRVRERTKQRQKARAR